LDLIHYIWFVFYLFSHEMTKLVGFLLQLLLGTGIWLTLLNLVNCNTLLYKCVVFPLPFWALVLFGVYSASTVLYRTFTFNDCPEAAKELLEEIDMARADLKRKGMKSID